MGDTPLLFATSGTHNPPPCLPLSGEGEWFLLPSLCGERVLLPDLSLLVKGPGETGRDEGVVGVERRVVGVAELKRDERVDVDLGKDGVGSEFLWVENWDGFTEIWTGAVQEISI